ncbi:MFS general substrate transporter [Neolentinus lepideus HHB14362 ss-1]|uniref:MFS general substrate transporter n=1 Tax=Neolentinus lepideus HHB14362 ss-1 TaxID=1314782 RepID=A0A165ULN9_9AGAM|nr:MFS general substrate transporter [Neolentinus lepideus HHB14362 ss-1]
MEDTSPHEKFASSDVIASAEEDSQVNIRRLMWKIDVRLVPILAILYLLTFLDRANIGNAVLFDLQQDLKLSSLQYNTVLVIFYVPYILVEIPSNVFLKKLRPHAWLSGCMFCFGLVSALQGFTQNYGGLLAARFVLGLCEAGMFPGCVYLLSMWYRREESQKRYTIFFASASLSGAFSGLLASAIGKMDGLRGYHGWRWVFILEGVATCIFSIIWFYIIPDFPEDCSFLSNEEREVVRLRLQGDVGDAKLGQSIGWRDVLEVIKDYKVLLGGFMYLGVLVPAYGYAYFAPTIIKSLGYGTIQAQLHSVPPWACSFVFSIAISFISDRCRHRYLFTIGSALIAVVGLIMLLTIRENIHALYGALFMVAIGTYTATPLVLGWFSMNLAGHLRRSVGSASQIGFASIAGIIISYSFPSKSAPRYTMGYAISLAFICLSILCSTLYAACIALENRRRDKAMGIGQTEMDGISAGSDGREDMKEQGLGDLSLQYRYML